MINVKKNFYKKRPQLGFRSRELKGGTQDQDGGQKMYRWESFIIWSLKCTKTQ